MKPAIILKNQRLCVEIARPSTAYSGSRFDWTGFITQITLDEKDTFCVKEQIGPNRSSGGIGFCNEFGIDRPIGYEDTSVGNYFPKIGVGMLKKSSEEPYDFFSPYEISPLSYTDKILADEKGQLVSYEVSSMIQEGPYHIHLKKTISLHEDRLSIDYTLNNSGEKTFETNEYCHNFIGINGRHMEDGYILHIPAATKVEKVAGEFEVLIKPNSSASLTQISWAKKPEVDYYALLESSPDSSIAKWTLYNEKDGVGLRDFSDFPVSKFALWGHAHVCSPELFIELSVAPGKEISWRREYQFFRS
ncbi:MAG: hypothetical protein JW708_01475 [Vallitaleaceae bacterium]|nr:hypothetical protein [Vallitaleaceae bacterium]